MTIQWPAKRIYRKALPPMQRENLPGSPVADEGKRLIMEAFELARESGRTDWKEMTIAVLKNRLLNLTSRAFREQDYGAPNISGFVRKYPELVVLDESYMPPKVTLIDQPSPEAAPAPPVAGRRIRTDLWNSLIDYRSGRTYIWNGNEAVPCEPDDVRDTTLPRLPTIDSNEMDAWRGEFARSLEGKIDLEPFQEERVDAWARLGLSTKDLPPAVRGLWNAELKRRVIERLNSWFSDHGIPEPHDVLQERIAPQSHQHQPDSLLAPQLRELILRCVRVMSEEELRELRLPPAAVLRVIGGLE
ncbi:hypothetical protein ABH940_002840 [Streptacidiphilus sp. BW17]|uniref:hypothetical protein n=1 Tax=Streptacidiphilus sp. BW17 TaxID=3156274 RepID=UPI003519B382